MITPDAKLTEILESYFGNEAGLADSLLRELQTEQLAGGQWLFRQGDPGDSVYFLIRGRLQVWLESSDEAGVSESRLLGEVVPGDTVGEISLLTGEQRTAGIRAMRDSTLVKVSREAFEHLAEQHPRLVMKLAGSVASVLHRRTSKKQAASGRFATIAILPIDGSPRAAEFCGQLSDALGQYGQTFFVSPDDLEHHNAPVKRLEAQDEVPTALIDWLHDKENENRFVVYGCSNDATPWSRYAVRQSDLVILVAEAMGNPAPGAWEAEFTSEDNTTIAKRLLVLLQPESATKITGTAQWLDSRHIDFHAHVCADRADDINRVARMVSGQALGLVLSAGAARGMAQLGVFRALVESGITVDWVGGTSIGAIMGAGIIAYDWDYEAATDAFRKAFVETRPFSDYTFPLMSLISGHRAERMFKRYLDYQVEDLPIPFFCVSGNLDDGMMNIHESGPLPAMLRATSSMPGIFPPAIINRRLTIDGAVLNNMPVDIMRKRLVGKVIAVDLSSRKTYTVEYDSLPSPWEVLRGRLLPFARKHRVPSVMTTILKSTEIGTLERMRELGKQADLLIQPSVRKFGMTDVKSFDQIVEAGYVCAKKELAHWLEKQDAQEQ
jgi:predicted acylesterase/phospholipase RssA/CRP-like cAMP-binding protein